MLWVKSFHIIAMVAWFAGLFYLPRLFVYHAMTNDEVGNSRFKLMERKLYYGIMAPGAILTILSGFWIISFNVQHYFSARSLHIKLFCVLLLIIFHLYCGKLRKDFYNNNNKHTHVFYRWINEIPTVLLIAIIILVIVKPF